MNKSRKIILITTICFLTLFFVGAKLVSKTGKSFKSEINKEQTSFKDGDIIFQTSQSKQCEAVRIATNSKFSHCGIIFNENGSCYVYEAIQPVKKTLFKDWIKHGLDNKYLVVRLKDTSLLTHSSLNKMKQYGKALFNKEYDIYFEWSNDKIYCSEYVWKIYKHGANIELCNLEKLKSFNLDDYRVKAILSERYGKNIPLEEEVVAPSQLANSDKLITIFDNY
ncbi:YiiX family permuted papain-like enzyme [Flavobacterium sp.]|uniref:YiiX family permuted papain-like enzyme n=1 Tax=Flavobacterium sp. TaxID=239 RepID=UPI0037532BF5